MHARALVEIALLVLFSLLDARDIWFKTRWLGGSNDSFTFASTDSFELAPDAPALVPDAPLDVSDDSFAPRASGWGSFLERCESLQAFHRVGNSDAGADAEDSADSFTRVLARRCEVGGRDVDDDVNGDGAIDETRADLVLSASVRPDSMAWAACSLLAGYRRPPICRDDLVADFEQRYQLPTPVVARGMLAEPMSPAEAELLALLDVIGASVPLSRAVCVEGVELERGVSDERESRSAHVFGCASPSARAAAFVGRRATAFRELHGDKAALTLDDASVLGMHLSVRQSAASAFRVSARRDAGLALEHSAAVALRAFGFLFSLLLLLDALLLLLHASAALELARVVVLRSPPGAAQAGAEASGVTSRADAARSRRTLLCCSLYRSAPVALLTVAAQLLGWLLLPAHAAVWTRSVSWLGAAHAALSLGRVWVLALLAVQSAWDAVAALREARAYAWARATHVSSAELAAAAAFVLLCARGRLVAAVAHKRALERQRLAVAGAFGPRSHALSNALGDGREPQLRLRESTAALRELFAPLGDVLFWSLLLAAAVLLVRAALSRERRGKSSATASSSASSVAPSAAAVAAAAAIAAAAGSASGAKGGAADAYARLPIEELLDNPIRARSLVRSDALGLEKRCGGETFLHASQLFEHGVVLEKHVFLRARRWFVGVLPSDVRTDGRPGAAFRFGGAPLEDDELDAELDGDLVLRQASPQQQPPPSPDAMRRRSLRW